jgi:hypothetical protein
MLRLPAFPGSWSRSDNAARVVIVVCRKGYLGIASSSIHAQRAVLEFASPIFGQQPGCFVTIRFRILEIFLMHVTRVTEEKCA